MGWRDLYLAHGFEIDRVASKRTIVRRRCR
jgi:hypothetical protein